MKKLLNRLLPILLLVVWSGPTALAQNRIRLEAENASPIKFDWTCASTSAYPKSLERIVLATMKSEKTNEYGRRGDRAVALDINGDRKSEYFVPLDCGGVGNCNWGVFAMSPLRKLGVINAEYIYVDPGRARWPELVTYGHLSAVEGTLTKYQMRRGRYRRISRVFPINHGESGLQIQGGAGYKMPRVLTRAKPFCE